MIPTVEAWRNAAVLGGITVILTFFAQVRGAWRWFPALVIAAVGAGFALDVLAPEWVAASLLADAPWMAAGLLAVWCAHADSRWLRARSWPAVVLAAALFGDRFVALGLALAEPDPGRRARLVLAASGASLIGVTSGAAPLILGWGGIEAVVVGLVLAAIGFVAGGDVGTTKPDLRAAAPAVAVPLLGAVVTWVAITSGALELVATGIEGLPMLAMPRGDLLLFAGATLAGALGDEGLFALLAREVELRALSVRGDTVATALRAGLAVGGGLPLLLLTGSRLRVGVPLWLAQVGVVVAWLFFR
jgi:hypothetical protein